MYTVAVDPTTLDTILNLRQTLLLVRRSKMPSGRIPAEGHVLFTKNGDQACARCVARSSGA